MSYDYCGYGQSSGKPNENNLNKACAAAYEKLMERYSIRPEQVILYGQSIGTGYYYFYLSLSKTTCHLSKFISKYLVPTTDLATKVEVAAVILHSPLSSGFRVLFPTSKRTWFFDTFKK